MIKKKDLRLMTERLGRMIASEESAEGKVYDLPAKFATNLLLKDYIELRRYTVFSLDGNGSVTCSGYFTTDKGRAWYASRLEKDGKPV